MTDAKPTPNSSQIRSSDITPPPELIKNWRDEWDESDQIVHSAYTHIALCAAQWGADQELEACCEWFVRDWTDVETADKLRAARRPKPPSLVEEALEAWERQMALYEETDADMDTIRRALERLKELEENND